MSVMSYTRVNLFQLLMYLYYDCSLIYNCHSYVVFLIFLCYGTHSPTYLLTLTFIDLQLEFAETKIVLETTNRCCPLTRPSLHYYV